MSACGEQELGELRALISIGDRVRVRTGHLGGRPHRYAGYEGRVTASVAGLDKVKFFVRIDTSHYLETNERSKSVG